MSNLLSVYISGKDSTVSQKKNSQAPVSSPGVGTLGISVRFDSGSWPLNPLSLAILASA